MNSSPATATKIGDCFNRAALQYSRVADLQQYAGQQLIDYLQPFASTRPCRILDLGCGPAMMNATLLNLFPQAQFYLLDIAPQMLKTAYQHFGSERHCYCQADFHVLPFAENQFDIIFANMSLQWGNDVARLLSQLMPLLRRHGKLVFSLPIDGTFWQLHYAQRVSEQRFVTKERLSVWLSQFSNHQKTSENVTYYYSDIYALVRAIKVCGANFTCHRQYDGLGVKKYWQVLSQRYETFRETQGLPLSYQLFYAMVENDNATS